MNIIESENIVKSFSSGTHTTTVLKGVSIQIKQGEFVAIMGRSGAGKSTLLYQLSLLDRPTHGKIIVDGVSVTELSSEARTAFRLERLGYVFQDYALVPELTALENVAVPLLMQGKTKNEAYEYSRDALRLVGLPLRFDNLPSQLSGGEQQRVSIARAIAHTPKILFADEPTANLDTETSLVVLEIFKKLHQNGQTIVMVTHEKDYGAMADRIIMLSDGTIINNS